MSGLYGLVFTKLTLPPPSAIQGKTILITGANTGLGREAARHALTLGADTIILGVRSLAKGEEAKSNIELSAGCSDKNRILVWPIDLESFASVQAFATRARKHVVEEGGRLDMAIMNAGLASAEFALTRDGWERGLQVNVLSTALLSLQLLPLLLRTRQRDPSSRPHLTIVASDIHRSIRFSERHRYRDGDGDRILPVLNDPEQWQKSQNAGGPTERYGLTKLLDIFVAVGLARLAPRGARGGDPLVVVNAVTPGFCKSELLTREKAPWSLKLLQALVARRVEEGSKTLLHAATQGAETHGKWLEDQAIGDPGNIATDAEAVVVRGKIWGEIIAILKEIDPEVCTEY